MFKKVKDLTDVSVGQNIVYKGCVPIKVFDEYALIEAGNDTFKVSMEHGIQQNKGFKETLYNVSEDAPRYIDGQLIIYKLNEGDMESIYLTINSRLEGYPLLIFKETPYYTKDCKLSFSRYYCFMPKRMENDMGYEGEFGFVSNELYNIAKNKALKLNTPMPKTNYVKKMKDLMKRVEDSKFIPLAYSSEHDIIIMDSKQDLKPQESNKLYLMSKCRDVIERNSNGIIFYSQIHKELEKKIKTTEEVFKKTS